jgi:hypothetical protein
MKVRKTEKVVETREFDKVVESYTECDRCKGEIKVCGYNVFECNFLYKEGVNYPEGGDWDETTMDLCEKCGKCLIETLENLG